MATKANATAAPDRPLLIDELAALPDVAPAESVPGDIAAAIATPRLYIHGTGDLNRATPVREGSAKEGAWTIDLPPGTFLGRPGATGERLARSAHKRSEENHTAPMRPDWAAQSFQARRASESYEYPVMQRIKGTRMEPYYGVYPPDDRQVYYPNTYPWRFVGRIFTWTNWAAGGGWTWSGSGVLVGPRHVLTAGHVCPWGSASWAMQFVPSFWNGAPLLGAGAQSWTSDYRGWNTNDTVAAHDIAVMRLYDPIGSWLGWMGTKVYDSSWNGGSYWTLAGYPGAVAGAQRPSYQSSIVVLDTDSDGDAQEIEHHGDATAGDSGGPFFGFWNDGPYAVGTTSGGEAITGTLFGWWDEDNNIEAGGKAMVDLVSWARSNWP
jgi:V8-like Glu-specific endopeptidase